MRHEGPSWSCRSLLRVAVAVLVGGLLAACGWDGEPAMDTPVPTPVPSVGGLQWAAPSRWLVREPAGMQAASYEVPAAATGAAARCSVFYFGNGRPGTMSANLDRWRAQFNPVVHDDRAERVVGGLRVVVVEIDGTYAPTSIETDTIPDALLLGAALDGPGGPVFVRCVGPRSTLDPARPEFAALVGSFSPL